LVPVERLVQRELTQSFQQSPQLVVVPVTASLWALMATAVLVEEEWVTTLAAILPVEQVPLIRVLLVDLALVVLALVVVVVEQVQLV
jgi:hypothetical protein